MIYFFAQHAKHRRKRSLPRRQNLQPHGSSYMIEILCVACRLGKTLVHGAKSRRPDQRQRCRLKTRTTSGERGFRWLPRLGLALGPLVVVSHLQASPPEAALDVEALVGLAAVQDALVAADLLGDEVEGLDDAQAELLALLVLGDRDVLNVSDGAEVVDAIILRTRGLVMGYIARQISDGKGLGNVQLALDNQGTGAHDNALGGILDRDDVVAAVGRHPFVLLQELVLGDVAHGGEHAQAVEEARAVV